MLNKLDLVYKKVSFCSMKYQSNTTKKKWHHEVTRLMPHRLFSTSTCQFSSSHQQPFLLPPENTSVFLFSDHNKAQGSHRTFAAPTQIQQISELTTKWAENWTLEHRKQSVLSLCKESYTNVFRGQKCNNTSVGMI